MIKTVFLTLLCTVLLNVTAQQQVKTYYDWQKVRLKENYTVNSIGQKSGAYKLYDQNGVVVKEYNYLNGLEHGLCSEYVALPQNQRILIAKGNYKNGKVDGLFVEYCRYSNYKSKTQEGLYKNEKKEGLWKEWWCTEIDDKYYYDKLKSIANYKNGNPVGELITYSKDGSIESKGSYLNGNKVGKWTTYADNGFILTSENYDSDGNKVGYWKYYSGLDSTKTISEGLYNKGIMIGKWKLIEDNKETIIWRINQHSYNMYRDHYVVVTFDSLGNLQGDTVLGYYNSGNILKKTFINEKGIENGKCVYYYESGEVSDETFKENGELSGEATSYYKNSKLKESGKYSRNHKTGEWKEFSESGKLVKKYFYYYDGEIEKIYHYDDNGAISKIEEKGQ